MRLVVATWVVDVDLCNNALGASKPANFAHPVTLPYMPYTATASDFRQDYSLPRDVALHTVT
jgi:hypothetical protein